jgi:hypothetical protein
MVALPCQEGKGSGLLTNWQTCRTDSADLQQFAALHTDFADF